MKKIKKYILQAVILFLLRFTIARLLFISIMGKFYNTGQFNWEAATNILTFIEIFVFTMLIFTPLFKKAEVIQQQFPNGLVDALNKQNELKERELDQALKGLEIFQNLNSKEN